MKRILTALVLVGLASGPAWAQCDGCKIGFSFRDVPVSGGTMTGPLVLAPGSAAAPSLTFSNDTGANTGLYLVANDVMDITVGGAARYRFTTSAVAPLASGSYGLGSSTGLWGGVWLSGVGTQSGTSKSLTDAAAATPTIRVPVATAGFQAGEVIWNAQSTDGTDHRTTAGRIRFAGVNKAATLTCTVGVIGTDLTASSNANTLACTWTNVVNTTNCDLSVTCTDNTAGSQTMTINVRADMPTTAALVFP